MQDSKKTPFHAYVSPTPGEITLFASGIVADMVFLIDEEIFSELLACNFNTASVTCTIDMDDRRKLAQDSLKNAKSAGVKIIAGNYFFNLGDPPNNITTDKCLDWAKKFYDVFKAVNPNDVDTLANDIIKGWCMKDEPTYEQMTDSSPNAYNLRTMVNYMIDNDNTRPIQINLVGGKSYKHSEGCEVQTMELPDGLTELPDDSFSYSDIVHVYLGNGIERIGGAFKRCEKLTDIYSPREMPPTVDAYNPMNLDNDRCRKLGKVNVHVRPGCAQTYLDSPWRKVGPIIEDLPDGVDEIVDDTAIRDDELCEAYSLSGVAVASRLHFCEVATTLPKGLYIIRTASGKSAKLAID